MKLHGIDFTENMLALVKGSLREGDVISEDTISKETCEGLRHLDSGDKILQFRITTEFDATGKGKQPSLDERLQGIIQLRQAADKDRDDVVTIRRSTLQRMFDFIDDIDNAEGNKFRVEDLLSWKEIGRQKQFQPIFKKIDGLLNTVRSSDMVLLGIRDELRGKIKIKDRLAEKHGFSLGDKVEIKSTLQTGRIITFSSVKEAFMVKGKDLSDWFKASELTLIK